MSVHEHIRDLEAELAHARKHPNYRAEIFVYGAGGTRHIRQMGAAELQAELNKYYAKRDAAAPATRAKSRGGSYCSKCKGPHVYKHGRP